MRDELGRSGHHGRGERQVPTKREEDTGCSKGPPLYRPTDQAEQVAQELTRLIDAELAKLRQVLDEDLASFNALLARKKVPGVFREPARGKP